MGRLVTKHSSTPGVVPEPEALVPGELAVNTADARLFTKHTDGSIKELGAPPKALSTRTITGTSGVITPADAGRMIISTSASPVVLTFSADEGDSWEVSGHAPVVHFFQAGAGAVVIQGDGFTMATHEEDVAVLDGVGAAATAMRTASNVWWLFGRLVAA